MPETLSVRQLIRDIAAEHPGIADPKDLVPSVRNALCGREDEILGKLLGRYIADVLREREQSDTPEEAWDVFLQERVHTADGRVVFARDATATDLEQGARRRRSFAGNLDRRAALFQRASEIVAESGAKTAGEVPKRDALGLMEDALAAARIAYARRRGKEQLLRETRALEKYRDLLRFHLAAGTSDKLNDLREIHSQMVAELEDRRTRREETLRVRARMHKMGLA